MRLRVASAFLSLFQVSTERRRHRVDVYGDIPLLWVFHRKSWIEAGGIANSEALAASVSSIAGAIDVFC
jgi:hypothetical protein